MPSVEWNQDVWNDDYDWNGQGDEWSQAWGGAAMQWYRTILPRINAFVPAGAILEIAPGFGRWTQYLKELTERLTIVDLAPQCIQACRHRFRESTHIEYHVNDGQSLEMIADGSIDFAFSFDSLVHVEDDVIAAYLEQLSRKLTPDGIGFIHHSNLGAHEKYFAATRRLPRGRGTLTRWGLIAHHHHRASSVSAASFAARAAEAGVPCVSQETINWGSRRLIDCLSVFTRRGSKWQRPNQVLENRDFMIEAAQSKRLAACYSAAQFNAQKLSQVMS